MNKYSIMGIAVIAAVLVGIGSVTASIMNSAYAQPTQGNARQHANNQCSGQQLVQACVSANVNAQLQCIQANVLAQDNRNC